MMSGMLAALVLGQMQPLGTASVQSSVGSPLFFPQSSSSHLVPSPSGNFASSPKVSSPLAMQRHRLFLFLTMLLVPKGDSVESEPAPEREQEQELSPEKHYHDEQIVTNQIAVNSELKAFLNRPLGSTCPKWLNCTEGYFDEGKDCYESAGRCTCIAHCCLAFDCRDWGQLVGCRRRCGSPAANRFGLTRTDRMECGKYVCERQYHDPAWDSRGANEKQRHCIAHCCYAFDCRRTLGYCRHACGADTWITARPLG